VADSIVTALLAKLENRTDAAADFARAHILEWRDQQRAKAEQRQREEKEVAAKHATFRKAQAELDAKRAECEAMLAPFVQRAAEAEAAYERAAPTYRNPIAYNVPAHPWVMQNPGDTAAIAELAFKKADGVSTSRIASDELAFNQRRITPLEMVAAILEENKHDDPAAWAAFALRWRHWANANAVDPGPTDQHYGPKVMGSVKRAITLAVRVVDRVL